MTRADEKKLDKILDESLHDWPVRTRDEPAWDYISERVANRIALVQQGMGDDAWFASPAPAQANEGSSTVSSSTSGGTRMSQEQEKPRRSSLKEIARRVSTAPPPLEESARPELSTAERVPSIPQPARMPSIPPSAPGAPSVPPSAARTPSTPPPPPRLGSTPPETAEAQPTAAEEKEVDSGVVDLKALRERAAEAAEEPAPKLQVKAQPAGPPKVAQVPRPTAGSLLTGVGVVALAAAVVVWVAGKRGEHAAPAAAPQAAAQVAQPGASVAVAPPGVAPGQADPAAASRRQQRAEGGEDESQESAGPAGPGGPRPRPGHQAVGGGRATPGAPLDKAGPPEKPGKPGAPEKSEDGESKINVWKEALAPGEKDKGGAPPAPAAGGLEGAMATAVGGGGPAAPKPPPEPPKGGGAAPPAEGAEPPMPKGGASRPPRPSERSDSDMPEAPSPGAVQGALGAVMGAARACVSGMDEPSRAQITFASDGHVTNVSVSGAAAGKSAAGCITNALKKAHVSPFQRATYSIGVTIRP